MGTLFSILGDSNPIFPSYTTVFVNSTVIYHVNNGNNGNQICCFSLMLISFIIYFIINFIYQIYLHLQPVYHHLRYYTYLLYLLSCRLFMHYNNEKQMNLDLVFCYRHVSLVLVVLYWQRLSRGQSSTLGIKSAQFVSLLRHFNLLKLKKWQM